MATAAGDEIGVWRAPEGRRDATIVPWEQVKGLGDPSRLAAQVAAEIARLPRRPVLDPPKAGRHRRRGRLQRTAVTPEPAGTSGTSR